ncbi:hypothetical protein BKA83DRAFT_4290331 [Pisolithus microcarpus]|nr:hypothetical protein BKA83DRAFT_4290331 [Pisolithus microcarpus]
MRHSLRYSQDDESGPVFGELPLIHHPSAASRMGQVSMLPYRGYASFRFDDQAKHHDGTSRIHQPFGQPSPTELEVTWSTPSHAVAPQELHPSYSSGENILTSADLSIDRSIRAVATTNVAILHVLHDFATGMTSGCVGDYGCMDPVSDQRIGSNLPPFSLSDTSPTPYEPRMLGHLFHTGRGNLAILPGMLVANDRADDASIHHDPSITYHGMLRLSAVGVRVRKKREAHMKYRRPKKTLAYLGAEEGGGISTIFCFSCDCIG